MTKKIELKSKTRTKEDINIVDMRNAGFVPGVIYGSGTKNVSLKLNRTELEKVFKSAGESTLVDLQVDDNASTKVIIKDVQIDAIKDRIIHVDFYQVDMKKTIEVEIPFVFIGEAKAEKEQGALILKNMESVLVKCLPGDLVEHFEIDLTKLEKIGDSIQISSLELPESYELLSDENNAIVNATEHKIEVEEEPVEELEGEDGEDGEKKEGDGEKKEEEKK
jgi:large subunit ribosomal protein L25